MPKTRHHLRSTLIAIGTSGLLVTPVAAPVQAAEIDLEARMHATAAFPNAGGHAEYDSHSGGREFEISIHGVRRIAGKRVVVRVHGDLVGRMRVGPAGRAHLERHSGVPRMRAGNVVRVRTSGGRLVTAGALHRDAGD